MKASTVSAAATPLRPKNSRKGSTTAARRVRGVPADAGGSRDRTVMATPGSMNSAVIKKT